MAEIMILTQMFIQSFFIHKPRNKRKLQEGVINILTSKFDQPGKRNKKGLDEKV